MALIGKKTDDHVNSSLVWHHQDIRKIYQKHIVNKEAFYDPKKGYWNRRKKQEILNNEYLDLKKKIHLQIINLKQWQQKNKMLKHNKIHNSGQTVRNNRISVIKLPKLTEKNANKHQNSGSLSVRHKVKHTKVNKSLAKAEYSKVEFSSNVSYTD
jgi:hypothetical protein